MINEQIKQLVAVLQAYVNGKTIQYYDVDYSFKIAHPGERNFNNKWVDVDEDHIFKLDLYEYRIKPEPNYRPFKNAEECWQEMLTHQPFGWVKYQCDFFQIVHVDDNSIGYGSACGTILHSKFEDIFKDSTFADGAPFGVKEEI